MVDKTRIIFLLAPKAATPNSSRRASPFTGSFAKCSSSACDSDPIDGVYLCRRNERNHAAMSLRKSPGLHCSSVNSAPELFTDVQDSLEGNVFCSDVGDVLLLSDTKPGGASGTGRFDGISAVGCDKRLNTNLSCHVVK